MCLQRLPWRGACAAAPPGARQPSPPLGAHRPARPTATTTTATSRGRGCDRPAGLRHARSSPPSPRAAGGGGGGAGAGRASSARRHRHGHPGTRHTGTDRLLLEEASPACLSVCVGRVCGGVGGRRLLGAPSRAAGGDEGRRQHGHQGRRRHQVTPTNPDRQTDSEPRTERRGDGDWLS